MKILVVDDEQGVLDLYQSGLTMEGFQVLTATSGEKGFELAKNEKPDIILLDIIMPRMNGLDILAKIKNTPEISKIPVYLLTNLPKESSGDKPEELGASGYFVKAQFEPKTIAGALRKKNSQ